MKKRILHDQRGLTLVELMVAIAITSILLLSLLRLLTTVSKSYTKNSAESALQDEAETFLMQSETMMVNTSANIVAQSNDVIIMSHNKIVDLFYDTTNNTISMCELTPGAGYQTALGTWVTKQDQASLTQVYLNAYAQLQAQRSAHTANFHIMCEHVVSFSVTPHVLPSRSYVEVRLTLENRGQTYTTGKNIFIRNMLLAPTITTSTSSSYDGTVSAVSIINAPTSVDASSVNQLEFEVTGTGNFNPNVTWSLSGNTSSSTTVNARGVLNVSGAEPAGTLTITATSKGDTSISDSITVTVVPMPVGVNSVTVSPSAKTLGPGESTQLTATVSGTGAFDASVTWSGSYVDATGKVTIPSTVTSGSFTIYATSQQDSSKRGSAVITVQEAGAANNVWSLNVSASQIAPGESVTFDANSDGRVDWDITGISDYTITRTEKQLTITLGASESGTRMTVKCIAPGNTSSQITQQVTVLHYYNYTLTFHCSLSGLGYNASGIGVGVVDVDGGNHYNIETVSINDNSTKDVVVTLTDVTFKLSSNPTFITYWKPAQMTVTVTAVEN